MENNLFIPNGLLPHKATVVSWILRKERWSKVETRAAELLKNVVPNQNSEMRRLSVVNYLQCLFKRFLPCQVFAFGSVPLKTYLPDGDIDLTVFGQNKNLEGSLIHEALEVLENERKNRNAQFRIKDIQFIQAEVKLIKCVVEDYVVDISFNQLGGLTTLCFLEEVDSWIGQDHLFKRSVILIKAWCYYESRILGSQHRLFSTYALEVLVLYIFHIYTHDFAGPLEALYRFLDFFSRFDWKNYCISLWGPVPIASLPNMKAEPPRKDCAVLRFTQQFLDACRFCYDVTSNRCQDNSQRFFIKFFNIIDPLHRRNNLGRSVTRGNFTRIRSAIAFGAQHIARFLECSEDSLIPEFDLFFRNTWTRHGKGYWIDVKSYNFFIRNKIVAEAAEQAESSSSSSSSHGSNGINMQANNLNEPQQVFINCDLPAAAASQSDNARVTSDMQQPSSKRFTAEEKGKSIAYPSEEVHNLNFSDEDMDMDSGNAPFPPIPFGANPQGNFRYFEPFPGQNMPPFPQDPHEFPPFQWWNQGGIPNLFNYNLAAAQFEHERQMAGIAGSSSANGKRLLPLPFNSMTPVYSFPFEEGTSFPPQQLNPFSVNPMAQEATPTQENFVNQTSDILAGDFRSYWMNMQYGMYCLSGRLHESLSFPPPSPFLPNPMGWEDEFMGSYGGIHPLPPPPPSIPMMPPVDNRLGFRMGNQNFSSWPPRSSRGTGTFLPNPASQRRVFWRVDDEGNDDKYSRNERRREDSRNFERRPRPYRFNPNLNHVFKRVDRSSTSGTIHEAEQGSQSQSASNEIANAGTDSNDHSSLHHPSSSNPGVPEN